MSDPSVVFLDELGRLALPKDVQEEAGLQPGMPVRVSLRHGHIELELVERPLRLTRKGSLLVAIPEEPLDQRLTANIVRQTQVSIRNREPED
jgi:bifunctional DNA-binding transcriptional regulator/antitoxin component of YhaV-PrlF toxin-antitoxin module